ncbi:uncharacterized protein LOC124279140 [Haliotis rubra]|uniref:uncharacterized protein LOC124279140 n=1 Tax=Haliotis rubra TaxID=36100 RepID=UPI001EE56C34|nr:uncharacterized protein LOC124279140 [Haliotis rubra]
MTQGFTAGKRSEKTEVTPVKFFRDWEVPEKPTTGFVNQSGIFQGSDPCITMFPTLSTDQVMTEPLAEPTSNKFTQGGYGGKMPFSFQSGSSSLKYGGTMGIVSGDVTRRATPLELGGHVTGAAAAHYRNPLPQGNIQMVLQLQHQDGSWRFCSELDTTLCIRSLDYREMLMMAGLRSLGTTVAEEIQRLVSTLLAILVILEALCPELFPLTDDSLHKDGEKDLGKILSSKIELAVISWKIDVAEMFLALHQGIKFCTALDEKHPLVCRSLELADDWLSAVAKMLGDLGESQKTKAVGKVFHLLFPELEKNFGEEKQT